MFFHDAILLEAYLRVSLISPQLGFLNPKPSFFFTRVAMAGAELGRVCKEAALSALRQDINTRIVSGSHFESALLKIR